MVGGDARVVSRHVPWDERKQARLAPAGPAPTINNSVSTSVSVRWSPFRPSVNGEECIIAAVPEPSVGFLKRRRGKSEQPPPLVKQQLTMLQWEITLRGK